MTLKTQNQVHRIRVQRLEVEFEDPADHFKTRDELSAVCRHRLIPAMEKLFDKKYNQVPTIHLPKLVIDAGTVDANEWERALTEAVLIQLEQALDKAWKSRQPEKSSTEDLEEDDFSQTADFLLFYLKNGIQSWNSPYEKKEHLRRDLIMLLDASCRALSREKSAIPWVRQRRHADAMTEHAGNLLDLLASDLHAMTRLLFLVPEKNILPLLVRKEGEKRAFRKMRKHWGELLQRAGLSKVKSTAVILHALCAIEARGPKRSLTRSEEVSQQIVQVLEIWHKPAFRKLPEVLELHHFPGRRIFHENSPDQAREESFSEGQPATGALPDRSGSERPGRYDKPGPAANQTPVYSFSGETIYVRNAGLVLLHPFLQHLFENTGHTVNHQWDSPELHQRSVVLAQYLVSGEDDYAEHALFLNKLLTGFPAEEPLPLDLRLSEFEKREAGDLLESVISHWKALRNTGVPALRETFLMRSGKLTRKNNAWLLEVDQQVTDVLLGKIPWGFSTIKTVWMNELITVEWA